MALKQQVNQATLSGVCQLARSGKALGQLPGQQSYCKASNGCNMQGNRYGHHLFYSIGKKKQKSPFITRFYNMVNVALQSWS